MLLFNFAVDSNTSAQCIDIFTYFGFVKQIEDSTHFSKTTDTCIDNVFTNFDSTNSNVVELELSDHCGIRSNFKMNPKPSLKFSRFRSKVNDDNIAKAKNELKEINFVDILKKAPLKNKFGFFSDLFQTVIFKHMQITEKKKKNFGEFQNVHKDENCNNLKNVCKLYFDMCKDQPENEVIKEMYKISKTKYLNALFNCIKIQNSDEIKKAIIPQKSMFEVINKNTNYKTRTKKITT